MTTTASVGDKVVCQLLPGKALFQLENCQLDEVTHQITLIAASTKTTASVPTVSAANPDKFIVVTSAN